MSSQEPKRVVIVGQGYVGLPLAMLSVGAGHNVAGYEIDESRTKRLLAGESYVEDIPSSDLAAALATGRYTASTEARICAGFDIAVVTVPTPLREGNPDLTYIEDAARTLARYLRPGATVILESTTYPGTTQELVGPVLEEGSGLTAGADFHLGYSPERIDPGSTTWTVANTPKVVSGVDAASLAAVQGFYDTIVDTTVPVSTPKEAELCKLLENTFRHVNIALVNELAVFASDLGVNVWEAIDAASTKPFGFMRFTPGPGVGGHCLPIDPSYLSWQVKRRLGQSFRFVELANDVNAHMPDYVVRRLTVAFNREKKSINGSRLLLLGLSFKRNVGDARESPAIIIAERFAALGADVRAADPHVLPEQVPSRVKLVEASAKEVAAADAVVLLVDHDAFDLPAIAAKARYIFDTRAALAPAPNVERL